MYIYLTELFCYIEVNTVSQQYFSKKEKKENTKIRMKKKKFSRTLGLTPNLLSQNLHFNTTLGDPYAHESLKITEK